MNHSRLYKQIADKKNVLEAYFEVVDRLDKKVLSNKLSGQDKAVLENYNFNINKFINAIQDELQNKAPIIQVITKKIPKPKGKHRLIYIYSIRDRIKAQAIFNVLEKVFEKKYSKNLYSYRRNRSANTATRRLIRKYKEAQKNFVLVADIKDYTDTIDRKILKLKLKNVPLPQDVLELLDLFIDNTTLTSSIQTGILQGIPLIGLFANYYLTDIDKIIQEKVDLYMRVGDDLILIDKKSSNLTLCKKILLTETKKLKLTLKFQHNEVILITKSFNYLGYNYCDNTIGIKQSSVTSFISRIKSNLKYNQYLSETTRMRKLYHILFRAENSVDKQISEFLKSHGFARNDKQMKLISQKLYTQYVRYIYKNYTPRNHRKLLQNISYKLPSFYKRNIKMYYGKKI